MKKLKEFLILSIFLLNTQHLSAEEIQSQINSKSDTTTFNQATAQQAIIDLDKKAEKKNVELVQDESKKEILSLRKRDKYLSFEYSNTNDITDSKVNSGTTTSSQDDKVSASIAFGRNLGSIQGGILFAYLNEYENDKDDIKTKSSDSAIGIEFRFNFIDNIPGNNFIPFVNILAATMSGSSKTDNEEKITIAGQGLGIGGGLEWFPFSEIFAVKVEGTASKFNFKAKQKPNDLDMNSDLKSLNIYFGLYF